MGFSLQRDENNRDRTFHGSNAFPLVCYTLRPNHYAQHLVPWHWHTDLQFCVVIEGTMEFAVDQDVFILEEGSGIFINSCQLHRIQNSKGTDGKYFCLNFHPKMLAGYLGSAIGAKFIYPFTDRGAPACCTFSASVPWQREVLAQLEKIGRAGGMYYELTVQLALLEIWKSLVEHCFSMTAPERLYCDPQVKAMLRYLDEHYAEPFDLDAFAESFHLTKSACCRKFKQYVSCTITQYLENSRIWEAARMLITTEDSVTEIAHLGGFCNTSYFIKRFRALTGVTPMQYRKNSSEISGTDKNQAAG